MKLSDTLLLNLREILPDEGTHNLVRTLHGTVRVKPITLLIDSPGGDVPAGDDIVAAVHRHGNVTGVVTGQCNSMAISVFAACARRYALPHATFGFHSRKWSGDIIVLQLEDKEWVAEQNARLLDEQWRSEEEIAAAMHNKTAPFVRELCRDERTLTAQEAKDFGLVQGIINLDIMSIRPA